MNVTVCIDNSRVSLSPSTVGAGPVVFSITDPGLAAIRQINAARLSGLEEFAHTLTAPERTKLVAALARLLQRPEVAACRLEDR